MPDAPLASEIHLVESLSKVFAVALGILYLLGFLVVAAYLSQFGVSSFSVLQLQYLLAGIWLLGPPVLHTTILHAQRRFDERVVPEVPGKIQLASSHILIVIFGSASGDIYCFTQFGSRCLAKHDLGNRHSIFCIRHDDDKPRGINLDVLASSS